jgi:hypothetical protein
MSTLTERTTRGARSLTPAVSLYPTDIAVIGQPSAWGTADLVIDTNDVTLTRVVLTGDLVTSLYRQLAARLPLHLVTEEVEN